MTLLIGLLFLAAVVGLFKPYIPGSKRWQFLVALLVLAAVNARSLDAGKPTVVTVANNQSNVTASTPVDSSITATQPSPSTAAPDEKWSYSTDKDDMRGTTSRFADVLSDNEVDLQFPYGAVHGRITVRKRREDGINVMFSVDKGQLLCSSFSESYVSMKFDDGPIHRYRCTQSTDGTSETAFLNPKSSVLAALKKAKRTVVEAEFFKQGRKQFVFDSRGLRWN